jgi:hypothetical protein
MARLPSISEITKSFKTGEVEKAEKQITKLREIALHLDEENLALREEIEQLRRDKSRGPSLELSDGVYWRVEGGERTGPVCPRCYEEHRSLVNLLDGSRYAGKARWICTVCNRVFD